MKELWQRIFIYTFVLLAVFQLAGLVMHRYSVNVDEARRFVAHNVSAIAEGLEGQTAASAGAMVKLFNRRSARVWIVRDAVDEAVLVGRPVDIAQGLSDLPVFWQKDDLKIWNVNTKNIQFIATAPLNLADADAILYMAFPHPRRPDMWNVFFRGMIGFTAIGLILAFWMARGVSRPLRRLRGEVLEIAGGQLEARVSAKGPTEVRDVALAVNHMADNLSKYIRNMRQLVANISHELRSPIARMQVSLALLEARVEQAGDKKSLGQLRLLQEEMEHMNKLIGDTLLSSKLDLQGERELNGSVAFSELTAEMLRRHAPSLEKRSLVLESAIEEGISLTGDETLLCNLVSNFLDNAVKYTSAGGRVQVRLYHDGAEAVLEVESSHEPLEPLVLEQLFEPFYRGGIATGGGVGLGLALVRQIAQLHKGGVSACNTGSGVVFSVRLPQEG